MDRLKDKVALITGGGSGMGRASCLLFAREGAKVVVVDRVAESGKETAAEITDAGGEAVFVEADVSLSDDVQNMIDAAVGTYGRLDVLFNNAGIEGPSVRLLDYTEEDWHRVIAIDLTAVYLGMKYAIPRMLEQGGGSIVSTASVAGVVGLGRSSAYSAAKAGVIGLSRTVALEYAAKNIRVNCICPAFTSTPMLRRVLGGRREEDIVHLEPLGRLGTAEDIANAALFLASDESSFVTGTFLAVDGGYMAQ